MRKSLLLMMSVAFAIGAKAQMTLKHYSAPSYADYYLDDASWDRHSYWNLANVHDPTVMKAADGYYYMYQTDASYGNAHESSGGHFMCRRSKNLVDWQVLGPVMQDLPSWVKTKLNSIRKNMGLGNSSANFSNEWNFGFWAPCVRKVNNNLYRMYYAITIPGRINGSNSWGERAFIGLMETNNPANVDSWVDKGYVVTNYSDRQLNFNTTSYAQCYFKYNAIDPSYVITPNGQHWLIYGSWHSGFAAVQLNPSTGKTIKSQGNPWGTGNEAAYGKKIFSRYTNDRWQASEAPEVIYHNGYYYMFVAFDELSVAYNTRVVRSKNVDGPYYDITGRDFTNGTSSGDIYPIVTHPYQFSGDHGWQGISHCAVFDDGKGNWFYSSQQRFPANYNGNAYSNAVMLGAVRRIVWTDSGWPLVLPERYGNVPQDKVTESELKGTWQIIALGYKTSGTHMDASTHITLRSNHIAYGGGALNGKTWNYNASTQVLTIGDVKLCVSREVDWEASPRAATVVFAGLSGDGKTTYWGKRPGAASNNFTRVGSSDCSAAWWTAFSPYYSIPSNATQHIGFINHSSRENNWNNWVLVLASDADRGTTGYKEYFVLRSDWYGWGDSNYNASNISADYSTTNATSLTEWRQHMDGAYVDMTVKREGSKVYVTAKMTARDGTVMTETYQQECGDGNQNVRAFLVCDGSSYEIDPDDTKLTKAQNSSSGTISTTTAEGTVKWVFDQGTADQQATLGADLKGWLTTSITKGAGLTFGGVKELNDLDETRIGVTVNNEANPTNDNKLSFIVTPASGCEFNVTRISFTATRIGTDGGKIDVSWAGQKIASALRPARNKANPEYTTYSFDVTTPNPGKGHKLTFNFYNLGITKQFGLANIILEGTLTQTGQSAKMAITNGIGELSVVNTHDDNWYTLSGVKVSHPTKKGIYIHKGRKILVK